MSRLAYKVYVGEKAQAFHDGYRSGTGVIGGYMDFTVLVVVFGGNEYSIKRWIQENCQYRAILRCNSNNEAHVCFKHEADATAFVLTLVS